jgi:hypothetical protein
MTSTIIDMSTLPAPDVVEPLDYESIYQAALAEFRARMPDWSAELESDPVLKLIEVFAYRELLIRARVNEAAQSVMLAYATGADLDQIGFDARLHEADGSAGVGFRSVGQVGGQRVRHVGILLRDLRRGDQISPGSSRGVLLRIRVARIP